MAFVHLNVKTGYSFLEGALPMESLCGLAKASGMEAVAVTDRGNLHGAYEFYTSAKKAGIKPIMGCEVQLLPPGVSMTDRSQRFDTYSLVLLAKNDTGWRHLKELVSESSLRGYYYVPRIDWELLAAKAEGLIALSGGLGGYVSRVYHGWHGPRSKRQNSERRYPEEAAEAASSLAALFADGDFYLEFQDTGLKEERAFNDFLLGLRERIGVPGVATNNVHYAQREDAKAHRYLMCIGYRTTIGRFDGPEVDGRFFRSGEEMAGGWFADHPELLEASSEIAARCEVNMALGLVELPPFPCQDGRSEVEELWHSATEGLKQRFREIRDGAGYAFDEQVYRQRLEYELKIIEDMGFPGYFLIVQDFINWSKDHGIRVGPGRGSGAGSLVAWALRITDLDPLPYDLLFERFLNPERVSMPDFDVDFCQERRGEVIDYVTEKYGADRVGQIATFARLGGKSVIKDVAGALELPFAEINGMTKNIPAFHEGKPVTLTPKFNAGKSEGKVRVEDGRLVGPPEVVAEARSSWGLFEVSSELSERLAKSSAAAGSVDRSTSLFREVFTIATRLEGLYRQAGTHAGGVVIGQKPLTEYTPLFATSSGGQAAQFNMTGVEDVGLVKFDFLGLKNLDIISYAEDLVNEEIEAANAGDPTARAALIDRMPHLHGCDPDKPLPKLDIDLLGLDHPEPYKLISSGDTNGIFQLESDGMKSMLVLLKPDGFEDIVAAVALYRPGPMDQIPDYIKRKHGQLAIEYPHPALAEVLKPTYGHMVYQEQVMQTAQIIGGYSLGGADILRRAMGKKKVAVMDQERIKFCDGAKKIHGLSKSAADKIFDVMAKFAGYGFNKSHAAAYAKIAYQTAFLKTFHPVAFYCAQVTVHRGSTETVTKYLREAGEKGIEVLPPCVNASAYGFRPEGQRAIRFGLSAVKGLGDAVLKALFDKRDAKPFVGPLEMVERCGPRDLPRKAVELLIDAGGLDTFGVSRRRMVESLDTIFERASNTASDRASGQTSFFETALISGGTADDPLECLVPQSREWPDRLRLARERDTLGFFLSGHPTASYSKAFRGLTTCGCGEMDKLWEANKGWGYNKRKAATVAGIVVGRDIKNIAIYNTRAKAADETAIPQRAFLVVEDTSGQVEVRLEPEIFAQYGELIKTDEPLVFTGNLIARSGGGGDEGEDQKLQVGLKVNSVHRAFEVFEQQRVPLSLQLDLARHTPENIEALRKLTQRYPGNLPPVFKIRGDHGRLRLFGASHTAVACRLEMMDEVEELMGKGVVELG